MSAQETKPTNRAPHVVATVFCTVLLIAPALAGAQTIQASTPSYTIGDEWKYNNGWVLLVVGIDGSHVITTLTPNPTCPDCRYYRDQNFTVVKVADRDGAPVEASAVGFRFRDFPLEIGKEWAFEQRMFSSSENALRSYRNTFKVEGYGDIKTRAGTFKAFRILQIQENLQSSFGGGWTGRATWWYSPEVKATVKVEYQTDWGRRFQDFELTSYALK